MRLIIALISTLIFSVTYADCPDDPDCSEPPPPGQEVSAPLTSSFGFNSSTPSFLLSDIVRDILEDRKSSEQSTSGGASADNDQSGDRFGVIIGAKIEKENKDPTNTAGFKLDKNGFVIGFDYITSNNFVIGGLINFNNEDYNISSDLGSEKIDELGLGIYSLFYATESLSFNFLANYAKRDYDITRTVFDLFNTRGETNGDRIILNFGANYEYIHRNSIIGFNAFLEYDRIKKDAYTERDDVGLFRIKLGEDTISSLKSFFGVQISQVVSTSQGVLVPQLAAGWVHQFRNNSRTLRATLDGGPDVSVVTDDPDRDYIILGANVSAILMNGVATFISYERDIGHDSFDRWSVDLGIRLEF